MKTKGNRSHSLPKLNISDTFTLLAAIKILNQLIGEQLMINTDPTLEDIQDFIFYIAQSPAQYKI